MKSIFALIVLAFLVFSPAACKKKEGGVEVIPLSTGDAAPDFISKDVNGNTVRLSDYKGKVVLVDFWATWCPPCRELTPVLNKIYEKYNDKGFVVLALTPEENTNIIKSYIKENNVIYPVLITDMETTRQYGVISIPASFLISRDGRVAEKHLGATWNIMQELSSEIERLL